MIWGVCYQLLITCRIFFHYDYFFFFFFEKQHQSCGFNFISLQLIQFFLNNASNPKWLCCGFALCFVVRLHPPAAFQSAAWRSITGQLESWDQRDAGITTESCPSADGQLLICWLQAWPRTSGRFVYEVKWNDLIWRQHGVFFVRLFFSKNQLDVLMYWCLAPCPARSALCCIA